MKNNRRKTTTGKSEKLKDQKISRKKAIKKTGYIAVTAAASIIMLNVPNKAQASSPAPPPDWGG